MPPNKPCICMLAGGHPVLDRRIFHKEAMSLSKHGYSVTIVGQSPTELPLQESGIFLKRIPTWPRIPIVGFFHRVYNLIRLGKAVNADVYHGHDPESLVAGLLLKWMTGKKLVYDIHEVLAETPRSLWTLLSYPPLFILQWLLFRYSDLVLAATDGLAENSRKWGASNVVLVENFAILKNLRRTKPLDRSKFGIRKDALVLGYFGQMSNVMATYELIQGYQKYRTRHPNCRLLLIGNVADADVRNSIRNDPSILYLPFMRFDDVLPYYSLLDIGLMNLRNIPVAHMAVSTKLFEFMYYRIPVITGDSIIQNVRIIQKEKAGFHAIWNDSDSFASKITLLGKNRRLRQAMGRSGRKAVLRRYNWKVAEKRLLRSYLPLVA